ncbi:uncharacterized protein LOC134204786 [Armigeres subalbatus]|uniref:uncharacterized protein LOC134204786 n=1 Tax=Armigeres subalbatus TaxID=124917 RepID=UPI002ED49263
MPLTSLSHTNPDRQLIGTYRSFWNVCGLMTRMMMKMTKAIQISIGSASVMAHRQQIRIGKSGFSRQGPNVIITRHERMEDSGRSDEIERSNSPIHTNEEQITSSLAAGMEIETSRGTRRS